MGMFDSFFIGDEEVQTKQLGRCLDEWHLGDTVDANRMGCVIVEGRHTQRDSSPSEGGFVGLVIYLGIFVDYQIAETELEAFNKANEILQAYIQDAVNPRLNKVLDLLKETNRELEVLQQKNNMALKGVADVELYLTNGSEKIFENSWLTKMRWKNPPPITATREEKLSYILHQIVGNVVASFPLYKASEWRLNKDV